MKENTSKELNHMDCEEVENYYRRIDDNNYKEHLNLNIVAFSWANPGAMGRAGEVIIVSKEGTRYYTNYTDGTIEMANLMCLLQISKVPYYDYKADKKYKCADLGHGNLLYVKKKYAKDMQILTEDISVYELYSSWEKYLDIVMHKHTEAHLLYVKGMKYAGENPVLGDIEPVLYLMGVGYNSGEKVRKNKRKAAEFFQKAAELGYPRAQHKLGIQYHQGEGVKKDMKKAFYWMSLAAEQKYPDAERYVAASYSIGDVVEKDEQKCVFWLKQAAKHDDIISQKYLSMYYYQGFIVEKDMKKAEYWLQRAAEQGDEEAEENLEKYFRQ